MEIEKTSLSMLSGIRRGDNHAWQRFYERYRALVLSVGRRLHLQDTDIDDLMSMVMQKFFDKIGNFCYDPAKGRFRDYFARVVHNAAVDIVRKKMSDKQIDGGAQELLDIPDNTFMYHLKQDEELALVGEAFRIIRSKLPVRAIQAWLACRLQNRSARDVARFNGTSLATVYNDCALVGGELKRCVEQMRYNENGVCSG